ncbi:hypothetical protein [Antarcticirhabdus aurantiaca]|uniref:Uncharacterized protein n=1 Tax=Antarcticirhabdus aurantiaca TaxID=2606717 RepID=A0ACD4NUC4_9HYPH|nr:hypothetical protein [Antarcticirhabdus aurantiaca]WAJ30541.1 hypothetical protein OXU80_10190 [Jeongeuplla avenae]
MRTFFINHPLAEGARMSRAFAYNRAEYDFAVIARTGLRRLFASKIGKKAKVQSLGAGGNAA